MAQNCGQSEKNKPKIILPQLCGSNPKTCNGNLVTKFNKMILKMEQNQHCGFLKISHTAKKRFLTQQKKNTILTVVRDGLTNGKANMITASATI